MRRRSYSNLYTIVDALEELGNADQVRQNLIGFLVGSERHKNHMQ